MSEPNPSAEPIAALRQLRKCYGDFVAVEGLDLEVRGGKVLALLGPNGAGKTTTIEMLMGLLQPTSGTASIGGHDCFEARHETMSHVGYVPDEPAFYDYLRGEEIIEFSGEMRGLSPREAMERSTPLIERLRLGDALGEFATNYSRGMKKKLSLVLALLHQPELLILDEPTNGLDPFATRTLHELIRESATGGAAVFFSTHLLDQAEKICDEAAILHHGRLVAQGEPTVLREQVAEGGSLEDVFFEVAGEAESVQPEVGP